MKSIFNMLKNIRSLLPYFILVAIYFFFINLEARKQNNEEIIFEKQNNPNLNKPSLNDNNVRIKIPVIPYR